MKEIACELEISVKTAETHRHNFGRKLGNMNRSQLTAFALKHHLVDSSLVLWLWIRRSAYFPWNSIPAVSFLMGRDILI
ncbi:MAG TPA: LuxR C-terminal-related transcriptional regulator [Terracidiphilus sp.]|nr:LuxR C-terminal-related transcriptional regulator [Terracidiphilus sp.]